VTGTVQFDIRSVGGYVISDVNRLIAEDTESLIQLAGADPRFSNMPGVVLTLPVLGRVYAVNPDGSRGSQIITSRLPVTVENGLGAAVFFQPLANLFSGTGRCKHARFCQSLLAHARFCQSLLTYAIKHSLFFLLYLFSATVNGTSCRTLIYITDLPLTITLL
jgi:hypothetical protein